MKNVILVLLQRLGLVRENMIYYIGGADVLPAPLKGEQEQAALELLAQGKLP